LDATTEFNMNTIAILELNEAELEVAVGGKANCDAACILYSIYHLAYEVLNAFGDKIAAQNFRGKADGSLDACF
jgi:hypothetical protein